MNKLILSLCLLSYISCDDICKEDGLIANKEDNTSYIECKDGTYTFMRCPFTEDGLLYMVFNGKECVDSRGTPQQISLDKTDSDVQEIQPANDQATEQADEPAQSEEIICPSGTTYEERRRACVKQEFADPIMEYPELCPSGTTYDKSLNKCRSIDYADPIPAKTPEYEFLCPKTDGKFPDPRDIRCYFICENNVPNWKVCPGQTIFSGGEGGQCLHPSPEVMLNDSPRNDRERIQTRQAEREPDNVYCEPGTTYDPDTRMCKKEEIIDPIAIEAPVQMQRSTRCPLDTRYDSTTGRCIKQITTTPIRSEIQIAGSSDVVCPTNFSYQPSSGMCLKEEFRDPIAIEAPVQIQTSSRCPTDTRYDSATGRCIKEVVVDPIRSEVQISGSPGISCQPGFTYQPSTGKCRKVEFTNPRQQNYACAYGQRYDYQLSRCVPQGGGMGKVCLGNAYCPTNYSMDTRTGNCTSRFVVPAIERKGNITFYCDPTYKFDWVLHKCLKCSEVPPEVKSTPDEVFCPDHFFHDVLRKVCTRVIEMPPIINDGDRPCTCPNGYEWRPNMFECVKIHTADCIEGPCPPVTSYVPYRPSPGQLSNICPVGSTYDYTLGECKGQFSSANQRRTLVCGRTYCPTSFKLDVSQTKCTMEIMIPEVVKPGLKTYSCRRIEYTYDPIFHTCRNCHEGPVRERGGEIEYVCPFNGVGLFEYDSFRRECVKTIWVRPFRDYTLPPCDCPYGYYWSHHLLKCVRIEVAKCIEGPCPPTPCSLTSSNGLPSNGCF